MPWQRYAEEVSVAQGELYAIRPLEKVTWGARSWGGTHRDTVLTPIPVSTAARAADRGAAEGGG